MAFSMDETEEKDKGEERDEGESSSAGKPWIVIAFALIVALLGLMFYGALREFMVNSVPDGPQVDQE